MRWEAVAGRLDEPPVMFGNAGLDQVALDSLDARMRALLIELHKAAVTPDIASHDCSEAAGRQAAGGTLPLAELISRIFSRMR